MSAKLVRSETWECPTCNAIVGPLVPHGETECIEELKHDLASLGQALDTTLVKVVKRGQALSRIASTIPAHGEDETWIQAVRALARKAMEDT